MIDLPENPELPPIVAYGFVSMVQAYGYCLDYCIDSLFTELEKVFEDKSLYDASFIAIVNGVKQEHSFVNGLAAYLGETFVRQYNGRWFGYFAPNAGANFYTSSTRFGEFTFSPFAYVGYRLSNGVKDTGDLKALVQRNERSMREGVDYKRREIQEIIKQRKIAIDNEPWS
jgi:hypothetical protein